MTELQKYRDTVKKLKKSRKKFNSKKSYSSFWLDDDKFSRFSGLSSEIKPTNDIAKLIKLGNYQRAIANFVKIVTKRDIPVTFKGDTSYTNGQAVNLSTDIKDNTFDVVVGLALHEGSHIVLSDFKLLKALKESDAFTGDLKNILNWIEDRRIDQYIFSTSPGYRAYYHKMYDYYWNDKVITKALLAGQKRELTMDDYMFQIVNSLNPAFDAQALPGLKEIVDLINVRNIARLTSTSAALDVAKEVYAIIIRELANPDNKQPQLGSNNPNSSDQEQGSGSSGSENVESDSTQQSSSSQSGEGSGDTDSSDNLEDDGSTAKGEDSTDNGPDSEVELTPQELRDLEKAIRKQNDFLNNRLQKKAATSKKMVKQIQSLLKGGVDMQAIDVLGRPMNMLIYNYVDKGYGYRCAALARERCDVDYRVEKDKYKDLNNKIYALISEYGLLDIFSGNNKKCVSEGLELGALLGRKLQIRNESRSLEVNRLNSGKIDNKRLAHAGYGITNIFNQIHIDKYKRANLHISLDASGSMSGRKWDNSIKMITAICKAVTYVQNVDVQVTMRGTKTTASEQPVLVYLYDSRKNKLNHLITMMETAGYFGCTPEGICYEGMMRKNMIVRSSSEVDSYFLNVSDGMPGMDHFSGSPAIEYTARCVNKMKNDFSVGVISYFVTDRGFMDPNCREAVDFRRMYGRDAEYVNTNNVLELARTMNAKFLTQGKVSV